MEGLSIRRRNSGQGEQIDLLQPEVHQRNCEWSIPATSRNFNHTAQGSTVIANHFRFALFVHYQIGANGHPQSAGCKIKIKFALHRATFFAWQSCVTPVSLATTLSLFKLLDGIYRAVRPMIFSGDRKQVSHQAYGAARVLAVAIRANFFCVLRRYRRAANEHLHIGAHTRVR